MKRVTREYISLIFGERGYVFVSEEKIYVAKKYIDSKYVRNNSSDTVLFNETCVSKICSKMADLFML